MRRLPAALALVLAACVYGPPEADLAAPADLAMADLTPYVVPDPGPNPIGPRWYDVEPNDSPDHAAPAGTAAPADLVNGVLIVWLDSAASPPTTLGGTDLADHYVFNSGPAAKLHLQVCWNTQTNLADLTLYKVVDGQPLEPVFDSREKDLACENTAGTDLAIEANTKYLLEIRSVSGQGKYDAC